MTVHVVTYCPGTGKEWVYVDVPDDGQTVMTSVLIAAETLGIADDDGLQVWAMLKRRQPRLLNGGFYAFHDDARGEPTRWIAVTIEARGAVTEAF